MGDQPRRGCSGALYASMLDWWKPGEYGSRPRSFWEDYDVLSWCSAISTGHLLGSLGATASHWRGQTLIILAVGGLVLAIGRLLLFTPEFGRRISEPQELLGS